MPKPKLSLVAPSSSDSTIKTGAAIADLLQAPVEWTEAARPKRNTVDALNKLHQDLWDGQCEDVGAPVHNAATAAIVQEAYRIERRADAAKARDDAKAKCVQQTKAATAAAATGKHARKDTSRERVRQAATAYMQEHPGAKRDDIAAAICKTVDLGFSRTVHYLSKLGPPFTRGKRH